MVADNMTGEQVRRKEPSCEALHRAPSCSPLNTSKSFARVSPSGRRSAAWRTDAASCSSPTKASARARSRVDWDGNGDLSTASSSGTRRTASTPFMTARDPDGHGRFPPLARAGIVSLACTPPADSGRGILRWTARDIAVQAVEAGIVETIHYSTVSIILSDADLKPHLTRYWLHSQDPDFLAKASSLLWYYERAESLAKEGVLVICIDEKTGIQALGRKFPDRPAIPGHPLQREFEYIRHGVVHLQLALVVPTGEIRGSVIPRNDHEHLLASLESLDREFCDARRIELIMDNGSSHTAKETRAWLAGHRDRIRAHYTPTHASWLDQAELALSSFSRRYIRGAVVDSRDAMVERISRGIDEYNRRYAHPFKWSYTRHAMRDWYTNRN